MKRIIILAVSMVLGLSLVAGCGGGSATSATKNTTTATTSSTQMPGTPTQVKDVSGAVIGTFWSITPAQLYGMTQNKDFVLADTDTSYTGEIAGTDLFLNADNVAQELDKFPADKSTKIVVYCIVGQKSQTVAQTLVKAGYTRVMQLQGGLVAWQQQGYPVINNTRTMT